MHVNTTMTIKGCWLEFIPSRNGTYFASRTSHFGVTIPRGIVIYLVWWVQYANHGNRCHVHADHKNMFHSGRKRNVPQYSGGISRQAMGWRRVSSARSNGVDHRLLRPLNNDNWERLYYDKSFLDGTRLWKRERELKYVTLCNHVGWKLRSIDLIESISWYLNSCRYSSTCVLSLQIIIYLDNLHW